MGSFSMGFWVRRSDEEVIHVDDKLSFSNHVSEGVVHESLECGGGVAETKEYHCGFEESFVCDEGCFPLVAVLNMDIVVSPTNIKLGEVANVFQLVHEVRDEREGVDIMGGVFVEVAVVLTRVELVILLFDKEEEGGLEGV